ncbi:ABC transporter substrate-binding protein [Palleronia sp. LCG004]|uniref:ABC transporter substrate-binding protein n=1 Tax=Palleronia sp. LCG004 TaxID=3079304 RepID=UPI00294224D9|nr:ABC transporter substrate-binding protein [Palleronia sp. LCG004]WOI58374.1 ABC transporter substrate-binding protein [Palleronia sp. LCG004]
MRASRRISEALLAIGLALPAQAGPDGATGGMADPPRRVVSINVCTDQLAMMLAGKDQLVSVSFIASDPRMSAMTDEAAAYPENHGRAEEIYLLAPDLVLAGIFSRTATVEMLRRLGIPVETFEDAESLSDIPGLIRQMGRALGREAEAQAIVAEFERDLATLRAEPEGLAPRAALYAPNGYAAGKTGLSGEILAAAGFDNAAGETGGRMPLEQLAMADPDLVLTSETYPGASRAEEILDHPVLDAFNTEGRTGRIRGAERVCGTPHVLRAIADLAALRRAHDTPR